MNAPLPRPSRPGEEDGLKLVWKSSFGDSDGFLDLFFEKYYTPGISTLIEADNKSVSCIFTMSGTEYLEPGHAPLPCPYVYSLGTLPEYRGHGYGARVIQESVRRGFAESGAQWVTLLPAEESLYRWYEGILGSVTAFWAREKSLSAAALPAVPVEGFSAMALDFDGYGRVRELLLAKKPHVRFPPELLRWQEASCRYFGGGMYLLNMDGCVGCAVVETYDDRADIKELLLPDGGLELAVAMLAQRHGAQEYLVRTPLFWGGDECGMTREYVVAIPKDAAKMPSADAWWGLVFD